MPNFMYLVIVAATFATYVSSIGVAPGFVKYLPDFLSLLLAVFVVAAGARQRFRYLNIKYWLVFVAMGLVMACGPLANQEAVGPVIAGMRYYLRAMPLFFLPAVVDFGDRDIQNYLKVLLGIALLQAPLAIEQRYATEAIGGHTGDYVFGTLMISGVLSLFLIAVLCFMASLMIRGRISKVWFAVCFVILMIPMSINETKVTVFLLPLGLWLTFFLSAPPRRRLLVTGQVIIYIAVAAVIFVPIYDHFNKKVDDTPYFTIEDFLTTPGMVTDYLTKDAGVGTGEEAGRGDALLAPFQEFAHDPVRLAFGLGLGNASQSSLGSQFSGRYATLYWNFVQTLSMSGFLFEFGVLGTGLVLLIHLLLLKDALFISKNDSGILGEIAPGYVGAWAVITVGLFYITIHTFESLSFMFWFFSGLLAARRERLALAHTQTELPVARHLAPLNAGAG